MYMKNGSIFQLERIVNSMNLQEIIKEKMPLTLGETINIASENSVRVIDIILAETEMQTGKTKEEILDETLAQYGHNLNAIDLGLTTGTSLLLGNTGAQLNNMKGKLIDDDFINQALVNTISAQVGNHGIGLNPCAGTGDSCPYTGFIKALLDSDYGKLRVAEIACLITKIGSMFRVGKVTTGCNMEGFGAGSTAIAAAMVELKGGSAKDMERAMVLAISPTIANPCTPRVMVPGLCATHIGGAILNGVLAAGLAVNTDIEVNVPVDVMLAMATEVHPISGKYIVPTVVEFMQPFFKTKAGVEKLIDQDIKDEENKKIKVTLEKAHSIAKKLAEGASPIIKTLGEAVVGGSSQAVGSPTNCARIAHHLSEGKIKKVKVELYPELFARRGINIPGIMMASVFGSSTADHKMYKEALGEVEKMGIEVEIVKVDEYAIQRVTIETDKGTVMVDSLNRGGGRLVLRDAIPSREKALQVANELGIVLVEA